MMKNPREILLARHGQVMPKLDAIREQVLRTALVTDRAGSPEQPGAMVSPDTGWLGQFWRQLFWQPRRVWLGLACAWGFMALVNLGLSDSTPRSANQASAEVPTMMVWQAQQRYLEELILLTDAVAPEREPAPAPPQPHSQGPCEWMGFLDQAGTPVGYATQWMCV